MAQYRIRRCPATPEHGEVYETRESKKGGKRFYCSHQDHDGRVPSHPLGVSPQTRAYFTEDEVAAREIVPDAAPTPVVAPLVV